MKSDRVQIYPQCKSSDIETDFSNAAGVARGFLEVKKCNNCGHHGTFFPTINVKELRKPVPAKKVKNAKYFDETFAKGSVSYFFGIGGFFFLFISIAFLFYKIYTPALI